MTIKLKKENVYEIKPNDLYLRECHNYGYYGDSDLTCKISQAENFKM